MFDSNGNYITKWSVVYPAGISIDQNGKAYVINQNNDGVEI
jgi:DNA-binding beta-propeller fold protein YncE